MVEKNSQDPDIPKIPEPLRRSLFDPIGNRVVVFFWKWNIYVSWSSFLGRIRK